jgi:hypothetical protein
LTSGRRNQHATIIAANIGDWPDLHQLQELDPSFTNRLIMLPARGRFHAPNQSHASADCTDIQDKLDSLAQARARIILDAFFEYKQANNQLLPVPESMQVFKQLVIRSSVLQKYTTHDIKYTQQWIMHNVRHDDSRKLPTHTLLQMFEFHWQSNSMSGICHDRKKQHMTTIAIQQLLDAALASKGVSMSSNKQEYESIWLAGLQ